MSDKTLAKDCLELWDNYELKEGDWSLYVQGIEQPVGFIKSEIAKVIKWPVEFFEKDEEQRTVSVNAKVDTNGAFIKLCEKNEATEYFTGCQKWIEKKHNLEKLDYHPIFIPGNMEKNKAAWLMVPSPIRGILGILTAGVHMNVYSTKAGNVDNIWVSKRSGSSYHGCWDQIIAGGMEPVHDLDPWTNVRQEAIEESTYYVGGDKRLYSHVDENKKDPIGDVHLASLIWFWTNKIDKTSNRTAKIEMDHTEPGVRFCFDVEIPEDEIPGYNPKDNSSSGFTSLTVQEVKDELKAKNWKPNCGLVTLDFLSRKGLLSDEEQREMRKLNRPRFDLPIPEPFQRLNDEVNSKNIQ